MKSTCETASTTPVFFNVAVTVDHGSMTGDYRVSCVPEKITVNTADAVINYQITAASAADIVFLGMDVSPADSRQCSAPSISVSGKMLTFSDANSQQVDLAVTLLFGDRDGRHFSHDPQIQNDGTG